MSDLIVFNFETWSRIDIILVIFKNRNRDGWTRKKNEKNEIEHFDLQYLEFLK